MSRKLLTAARWLLGTLAGRLAAAPQPADHARRFAEALFPGSGPDLLVPTWTRVDVGRWFRPARLWVALGGGELVLFAPGPRPHCQRFPLRALAGSLYNPVTGELVLKTGQKPLPGKRLAGLRMPPLDAHRLLELIEGATARS